MFRRSNRQLVHLFTSMVSSIDRGSSPLPFTSENLNVSKSALEERSSLLGKVDLLAPLSKLATPLTPQDKRKTIQQFCACGDDLRSLLYKKSLTPLERLQIHEAIMGAGYYERLLSSSSLKDDHLRFVLNHYNFDVRRDLLITGVLHKSLVSEEPLSTDSEKLLNDVLLLERRLYGDKRFSLVSGSQSIVLGLKFSDVTTESELSRFMNLSAVKEVGNFALTETDDSAHWIRRTITPQPEAVTSFAEASGMHKDSSSVKTFELKIQKPEIPKTFWERFNEKLLRYWVIWFSLWVMFFMVDEEIITLVALLVLKWKQTAILEEEARKTGGKVYIASSIGRAI